MYITYVGLQIYIHLHVYIFVYCVYLVHLQPISLFVRLMAARLYAVWGHLSIGGIYRGASIIGGSRTHKLMSKFSINFRSTFHSFNERAAIAIKSSPTMAFIFASFLSLSFFLSLYFIPLLRVH